MSSLNTSAVSTKYNLYYILILILTLIPITKSLYFYTYHIIKRYLLLRKKITKIVTKAISISAETL